MRICDSWSGANRFAFGILVTMGMTSFTASGTPSLVLKQPTTIKFERKEGKLLDRKMANRAAEVLATQILKTWFETNGAQATTFEKNSELGIHFDPSTKRYRFFFNATDNLLYQVELRPTFFSRIIDDYFTIRLPDSEVQADNISGTNHQLLEVGSISPLKPVTVPNIQSAGQRISIQVISNDVFGTLINLTNHLAPNTEYALPRNLVCAVRLTWPGGLQSVPLVTD